MYQNKYCRNLLHYFWFGSVVLKLQMIFILVYIISIINDFICDRFTADVLEEDFESFRTTTPRQGFEAWDRDFGLPDLKTTLDGDASSRPRAQQDGEPGGAPFFFCDTEMPGSASLKG